MLKLNTRKEDIPVVFDYGYIFCTEVKILTISFACDIEGDSSLLYVGGIAYGSRRSCGKT